MLVMVTHLSSILVLALSSFSRICGSWVSSSHADPQPNTRARSFPVPKGSTPSWHCIREKETKTDIQMGKHKPQTATSSVTDSLHRPVTEEQLVPEGGESNWVGKPARRACKWGKMSSTSKLLIETGLYYSDQREEHLIKSNSFYRCLYLTIRWCYCFFCKSSIDISKTKWEQIKRCMIPLLQRSFCLSQGSETLREQMRSTTLAELALL